MAFDLCVIPVSTVPYLSALQTRQFSMTEITAHLVSEKLTREQCRSMTPETFSASYGSSAYALHVRSSVSSEINLALTSSANDNAPTGYSVVIQGYLVSQEQQVVLGVCVSDEPIVADISLRLFVNIEETNNVFRLSADFDGMVTQGLLDDILETYVTTDTDQDITGEKTFTESSLKIGSDTIKHYSFKHGQEFVIGTQTASTNAWTGVSVQDALYDGMCINFYLPYAGTTDAATLTLTMANGSTTAAIPIKYRGNNNVTTTFPVGSIIQLTYCENKTIGSNTITGWFADSNYVASITVSYERNRIGGRVVAGSTGLYAFQPSLLVDRDGNKYVSITTSSTAHASGTPKTCTTLGFYPESILTSDTSYASGSIAVANKIWRTYTLTVNQCFGTASLTASRPVYLVCTFNRNDGKFYLDTAQWWSQTIPQQENGKLYIFLGITATATAFTLDSIHPILCYKDGRVQEVTYASLVTNDRIDAIEESIPQNLSDLEDDLGVLTEHQSLAAYPTSASYNSSTKKITFKNASNTALPNMEIDATDFIKDGMVSDVAIQNDNLVVSFNTDAGKEDISIPLSSIFDPSNYYTKTQTDTQISNAIDALGEAAEYDVDPFPITDASSGNLVTTISMTQWVRSQNYAKITDLPTVNNAALTIQRNGATIATFTANASSGVTADISVPENTSDLENDSGFVSESDLGDAAFRSVDTSIVNASSGNLPTVEAVTGWVSSQLDGYAQSDDIPTVGNATITIQKRSGTSAGNFTTNATANKTINLSLGAAADKAVDTSISNTSSTNLPTTSAVATWVNSQTGNFVTLNTQQTITARKTLNSGDYNAYLNASNITVEYSPSSGHTATASLLPTGLSVDGVHFLNSYGRAGDNFLVASVEGTHGFSELTVNGGLGFTFCNKGINDEDYSYPLRINANDTTFDENQSLYLARDTNTYLRVSDTITDFEVSLDDDNSPTQLWFKPGHVYYGVVITSHTSVGVIQSSQTTLASPTNPPSSFLNAVTQNGINDYGFYAEHNSNNEPTTIGFWVSVMSNSREFVYVFPFYSYNIPYEFDSYTTGQQGQGHRVLVKNSSGVYTLSNDGFVLRQRTTMSIKDYVDRLVNTGSGGDEVQNPMFVVQSQGTTVVSSLSNLSDYRTQRVNDSDNPHYKPNDFSVRIDVPSVPANGSSYEVYIQNTTYIGSIVVACNGSHYGYPIYFRGETNLHCPTVPGGSVIRLTLYNNAFYGDFYDLADFGDEHEAYVYVGRVPVNLSDYDLSNFSGLIGMDKATGKYAQLFDVSVTQNGASVNSPELKKGTPIYVCFYGECFAAHPKVPFGNILRIFDSYYVREAISTDKLPFTFYPFTSGDTVDAHVVTNPNSTQGYKYFHMDNCPVYISSVANRVLLGNPPESENARLIGFLCKGAENSGLLHLVDNDDVFYVSDDDYSKTFAGVWDYNTVDSETYALSGVSTFAKLSDASDNVLVGLSKNSSKLVPLLVYDACGGDLMINADLDWDSPVYALFEGFRCFSAHPLVDFRQVLKYNSGSFMFTFSPMSSETPSVAYGNDGNQYFGSANYPVFISDFYGGYEGYKSFCVGIPSDVNIPSSDIHWRLLGYTTSTPGYIRLVESHPFLKDFIHQTGGYVKLSKFTDTFYDASIGNYVTPSQYVDYFRTNNGLSLSDAVNELVSNYGDTVFHLKDLDSSSIYASESDGEVFVSLPYITTVEFKNRMSFRISSGEVSYIDHYGVYHGKATSADSATTSTSSTYARYLRYASTNVLIAASTSVVTSNATIRPVASNSSLNLGTSAYKWGTVYATYLGDLSYPLTSSYSTSLYCTNVYSSGSSSVQCFTLGTNSSYANDISIPGTDSDGSRGYLHPSVDYGADLGSSARCFNKVWTKDIKAYGTIYGNLDGTDGNITVPTNFITVGTTSLSFRVWTTSGTGGFSTGSFNIPTSASIGNVAHWAKLRQIVSGIISRSSGTAPNSTDSSHGIGSIRIAAMYRATSDTSSQIDTNLYNGFLVGGANLRQIALYSSSTNVKCQYVSQTLSTGSWVCLMPLTNNSMSSGTTSYPIGLFVRIA